MQNQFLQQHQISERTIHNKYNITAINFMCFGHNGHQTTVLWHC